MAQQARPQDQLKVVLLEYVMPILIALLGYIGLQMTGALDTLDKRVDAIDIKVERGATRLDSHDRRITRLEDK